MSYDIVWEFRLAAAHAARFEQAYGPEGAWVELFRHAPGFIETRLLRDAEDETRYLTVDRWESRDAFEDFKRRFATEYRTLDAQLEGLALSETRLGAFDAIP
ncbi:antibiotic biosynthesis monooxygenase family protein [Dyella sp. EPa41]|uniref:antibiotic biosynthesis monooxygenase family protein n=1 Tax=Dyella sp. EPa41 TaxID=1561194 RepID=UPI0019165664|nr:antibiotic biosynthesis monooxygenase family protein [Dyella sp. EPa41]